MAKRKVQADKNGVYVKINNTTYRPDTLLEKDTEYTRQVREYYAQLTESTERNEANSQPTLAEKGQAVNVEEDGEARAVTVSIPLSEHDEGGLGDERNETWFAADVPELTEEQKSEIRRKALENKNAAKHNSDDQQMDFFKSLLE